MEAAAILVAIAAAIFLPLILILSGERWRTAQDRARAVSLTLGWMQGS